MLIAISIVRNEADRYLRDWLANVATYADRHVVLDDGSDDRTVAILLERATIDPRLTIEANDSSIFAEREQMLRAQSWELARRVARPGDWIIIVDADEFFDGEMVARKTDLLARPESRVRMCRLDLWAEDLYRVDGYWSAAYSPMFRFQDLPFGATGPGLNESPLPAYARDPSAAVYRSAVRCLHKGWLRDEDKRWKHEFYLRHVQRPFDRLHVRSSLERSPRLRRYHADYRCLSAQGARARFATRERTGEWIRPPLLSVLAWRRRVLERLHRGRRVT